LNLLWASWINPRLSAYIQLNGTFDYNATPMAPPGTQVLLHEKPSVLGSWALHGEEGWYSVCWTSQEALQMLHHSCQATEPILNALETQLHSFQHTQPCQHSHQWMQPCKQLRI
jgi:hypothetical protein